MTTKLKEYKIKVPYTLDTWRKGQRYVLAKYTTDEVSVVHFQSRKEDGKIITETKKVLNLSKRLPSIISKVLNEKSLFVEEFSTNIDVIECNSNKNVVTTNTNIKTEGALKEMDITRTQEMKNLDHKSDPLRDITTENMKDGKEKDVAMSLNKDKASKSSNSAQGLPSSISFVSSTCETSYINRYYDTNTFSLNVKTSCLPKEQESAFGLPVAKVETIDLTNGNGDAFVFIHKLVDVKVNSMIFGWIADHVKKTMRDMLIKFQQKIIDTEAEWKDIKEDELGKMEQEMIKKFFKNE